MPQLQKINDISASTGNIKATDRIGIRNEIFKWEAEIMKTSGAVFGDNDLFPVKHSFTDKIYTREMFIPKGGLLTGRIWKDEFPFFLLKGELIVVNEFDGKKTIKAPCSLISKPGAKRLIYAIEDSIMTTVHHNPDNLKDTDICLDRMTCENYSEYEKCIANGKEQKYLAENSQMNNPTDNCGLSALKNMSDLKNMSVRTLVDMASDNGIKLYPYKVSVNKLSSIPLPAIVHSEDHFDYISSKEEFDDKLKYTGYILLTQKADYPKIKSSEFKKINGATGLVTGIVAIAASIGTAIATSESKKNQARPQCEKDCKTTCKSKHGALFSGRRKCIKGCRSECIDAGADMTPSTVSSGINWYYVAAGIIAVAATLLLIFRKKLFPKK